MCEKEEIEETQCEAVYAGIREMVKACQFRALDSMLLHFKVRRCRVSVLLSMLTATAPEGIKRRLPSRPMFYRGIKQMLTAKEGPVAAAELLQGLE